MLYIEFHQEALCYIESIQSIHPPDHLLHTVDEMISPVHLLGLTQLCHVGLGIHVGHTVLKVLGQTVDGTVSDGRVVGV